MTNKKLRLTLASVIACSLLATTNVENVVKAATLDDVRELLGQQRLTNTYTEDEQKEITAKYTEIETHNNFIKSYDNDKVIALNEETERGRRLLEETLSHETKQLGKQLNSSTLPTEILKTQARVKTTNYQLSNLREKWDILETGLIHNPYTQDYNELQAHLKLVRDTSNDIGDIGATLKSPLLDSLVLKMPFGYSIDPNTQELLNNRGIDLEIIHGNGVHAQWNGTVKRITQDRRTHYTNPANEGYTVLIEHVSGLQTRYTNLDKVTVKQGQSLFQYDPIGTTDTFLHFEVLLNEKPVNPMYFYGAGGKRALENFIMTSSDPFHQEMTATLDNIKDDPEWLAQHRKDTANPYIPGEPRYVEPVIFVDKTRPETNSPIEVTLPEDAGINPSTDVN